MSDVTLSYKGSDILELSDSGSATLKTGGTYCEADIELAYTKPSGGGMTWQEISVVGSGSGTITIPLVRDTTKGFVLYVKTTEEVPNTYSPEILKRVFAVDYGVDNHRKQVIAIDSNNTQRSPSLVGSATSIRLDATRAFSSEYTYVAFYAEFENEGA